MEISLEQAIEIHAKVLRHSHGDSAPRRARDFAANWRGAATMRAMSSGRKSPKWPRRFPASARNG